MSYVFQCPSCSKQTVVSTDAFNQRIAGRKVTLRCKACQKPMPVDGTKAGGASRPLTPTPRTPLSGEPRRSFTPNPSPPRPIKRTPLPGNKLAPPPSPPPVEEIQEVSAVSELPEPPAVAAPVPPPPPSRAAASPRVPAPPPPVAEASLPSVVVRDSSPVVPPPAAGQRSFTPLAVVIPRVSEPTTAAEPSPPPPSQPAVTNEPLSPSYRGRRVALMAASMVAAAAVTFLVSSRTDFRELHQPRKQAAAPIAAEPAKTSAPLPVTAPAASAASQAAAPSTTVAEPPAAPSPAAPGATIADDGPVPSDVSKRTVLALTAVSAHRAQRCHPNGHAVGTAQAFITFAANGRVSDARLEGEPVASAPVARCILDHLRSTIIPKFKGEPFTIQQQITMR